MSDQKISFAGTLPAFYDEHLGPFLFEFAAADLAARVAERVPLEGAVLELACGTGILTEQLRDVLPDTVAITATDLSEGMLAVAKEKRGDLLNVTYEVVDASTTLPFEDAQFDVVVSQFGIMFFPDKAASLREMHRVTKPRGVLAFNVWGSIDHNPIVPTVQNALAPFFDGDPPNFFAIPFGMADSTEVTRLIEETGYTDIESSVVTANDKRPSAESIARGLIVGTPIHAEIEERANADIETIVAAVAKAIESEFGAEPAVPRQEVVYIARKPS